LFSYCSEMLIWIFGKFTNWCEPIWINFEKVMKEIENRKEKEERR
jgi:hypothetical protein